MHIWEGLLAGSPQGNAVLVAGAATAGVGTLIGLAKTDYEQVPQVAMLSAAFFVVSLVEVPLGGTSVHLVLTGLIGLVLGWAAFPAVLIGLVLQAQLFGIGGLTTLGLNTTIMALPAVLAGYACGPLVRSPRHGRAVAGGAMAGAMAVLLGAVLSAAALVLAGQSYRNIAAVALAAHLPVLAVESAVTASVVGLLHKVRPELLLRPATAEGR
jgi:cobalt/nickel transport system permease protein